MLKIIGTKLGWILGLGLAVSGCSKAPEIAEADIAGINFTPALQTCCAGEDKYPIALVNAVETNSISSFPLTRSIVLRQSYLQDEPEAHAVLLDQAKPLDIILIANGSRLSGAIGDGYFGHSALIIGSEADLRALGVWSHPAITPFHERIRAGGIAIESIDHGVHLSDAHTLLETDSAALFQVTGLNRAETRAGLIHLFREIGKPFDHHFDLDTPESVFCTELIHDAVPSLDIPVTITYGRRVVWPDEVATQSLLGNTGYRFAAYVKGSPFGWRQESQQVMAAQILQAWP